MREARSGLSLNADVGQVKPSHGFKMDVQSIVNIAGVALMALTGLSLLGLLGIHYGIVVPLLLREGRLSVLRSLFFPFEWMHNSRMFHQIASSGYRNELRPILKAQNILGYTVILGMIGSVLLGLVAIW